MSLLTQGLSCSVQSFRIEPVAVDGAHKEIQRSSPCKVQAAARASFIRLSASRACQRSYVHLRRALHHVGHEDLGRQCPKHCSCIVTSTTVFTSNIMTMTSRTTIALISITREPTVTCSNPWQCREPAFATQPSMNAKPQRWT